MTIEITPTVPEVDAVTGETVTEAQISTAQAVIETMCGYDLSDTVTADGTARKASLYRRDLRLLRQAVIWQAAYVKANPDIFTRAGNLKSAQANGVAVSWGPGGSAGSILSPLASMSLQRLSWRRSRSQRLGVSRAILRPSRAQTLLSDGASSDWRPLR